jgi:hypothetical protein
MPFPVCFRQMFGNTTSNLRSSRHRVWLIRKWKNIWDRQLLHSHSNKLVWLSIHTYLLWEASINLCQLQACFVLLFWQLYGLLFCPHHLGLLQVQSAACVRSVCSFKNKSECHLGGYSCFGALLWLINWNGYSCIQFPLCLINGCSLRIATYRWSTVFVIVYFVVTWYELLVSSNRLWKRSSTLFQTSSGPTTWQWWPHAIL